MGKFTSCYPQLNYEKSQYVQTGDIAKTIEQMRNDNGAIRFAAKQAGNSYNQISSSGFGNNNKPVFIGWTLFQKPLVNIFE